MIQAPIFHVNGDDPEAVVRVAHLAFEFRQAFHKDVVIDLVTYRRRGHNEADDPSLTQPLMYELIDAKRSVRKHYTESLIGRGDISVEEAEEALRHFQEELETIFQGSRAAATAAFSDFSEGAEEVVRTGQLALAPMGPAGDIVTGITQEMVDWRRGLSTHHARGLHPPSPTRPAVAATCADGRRRRDRLGHGRGSGDRITAHGGPLRAPGRTGFTSRYLRAPPRGHRRQVNGVAVQAVEALLSRRRPNCGFTTRCSASSPRSDSSTATPLPVRTHW